MHAGPGERASTRSQDSLEQRGRATSSKEEKEEGKGRDGREGERGKRRRIEGREEFGVWTGEEMKEEGKEKKNCVSK